MEVLIFLVPHRTEFHIPLGCILPPFILEPSGPLGPGPGLMVPMGLGTFGRLFASSP